MIPLILSMLSLIISPSLDVYGENHINLKGIFQWTVNDYRCEKYREVIKDLEVLTSYFEERNKKRELLEGKIYLLMGAAYEKLRQNAKAEKNYRIAKKIFKCYNNVEIRLEGIDFKPLKYYRKIILEKKNPPYKPDL